MKNISILGSTGSIGRQTIEAAHAVLDIRVMALSANDNIDLLEQQIKKLNPRYACVMDDKKALALKRAVVAKTEIVTGLEGLIAIAEIDEVDTVVTSVVGNVGLLPTLAAIKKGKRIALANKETLVSAGEIVMSEAKKNNAEIIPVDSEHSAIFQCLAGNAARDLEKIILTASGGPFRGRDFSALKNVTVEEALRHPNWVMGKKISIDSATMMNKGLEVIEAKWLFSLEPRQIQVLIHPQSIIHSMVEYVDGTIIAQLGQPDMRIPIAYALTYPDRVGNHFPKMDFSQNNTLTFSKAEGFPCLQLAFDALRMGGVMPCVLNAANEAAVTKFLNKEISFTDIPLIIDKTMNAYTNQEGTTLENIMEADRFARRYAENLSTESR